MTNSNQLRFLRLDSERKKQVKLNGFVAEVASPSRAILVRSRFFLYISVKTCSKQLCSEIKGIAGKMTENTLNCWFCNVFSFQLHLCVWFYVCCNRLFLKNNINFSTETHVPTPLYDHSLTHTHNHITPAVARMDSCFALG